jgi:hypothetical protein
MSLVNSIQAVGSLLTGFGALIVIFQLYQRRRQFKTEFEDKLTSDYREIIYEIPVESLLDEEHDRDVEQNLKDYYRYIDLTNDQIFLRKEGRVSKSTWEEWAAGIEANFKLEDFNKSWKIIHDSNPDIFNEIQNFLDPDMHDDPRYWEYPRRAKFEKYLYRFRNFWQG